MFYSLHWRQPWRQWWNNSKIIVNWRHIRKQRGNSAVLAELNPVKKLKGLQLCKEEKAKLLTKEDRRNTQKYSSVDFISAYWGISAGNKHLSISGWKCRERDFEGSLRWGKNVLSLEIFSWIINYWILPLYKMKNSADFGGCYQASVDNTFRDLRKFSYCSK